MSNSGLMVGFICHVFPGTKPSEYMAIDPSPRAMNVDGRLAVQVLKALNPSPDDTDSSEGTDMAKRKVNMSRAKINKRDPYVQAAIKRRSLKL